MESQKQIKKNHERDLIKSIKNINKIKRRRVCLSIRRMNKIIERLNCREYYIGLITQLLYAIVSGGILQINSYNTTFADIIFTITNSLQGCEIIDIIYLDILGVLKYIGIWILLYSVVCAICIYLSLKEENIFLERCYVSNVKKVSYVFLLMNLIFFPYREVKELGVDSFLKGKYFFSNFLDENYVDTKTVISSSLDKKRNLILISLESFERSFADKTNGGLLDKNYIPYLTKLADENICFTSIDVKNMTQIYSGFTYASMVSSNTGLPYKICGRRVTNNDKFSSETTDNVMALGDILKWFGYTNYYVSGMDARFAGTSDFLKLHGEYKIYDYEYAKESGYVSPDYKVAWGMEDKKVFEWSKIIIQEALDENKPFCIRIDTMDTHSPNGYVCEECSCNNESSILRAISCEDKRVFDFVKWVQGQEWYDNTTIVILGDHLFMSDSIFHENN